MSQIATSSPTTTKSNNQEDQNIDSILLPEHSLEYNYSDLTQISRSFSITNLFHRNQLRYDKKESSSPPLFLSSSPLPIQSPEKSTNSSSKNCFDLNPQNSTVYKNALYLETSFDVNPPLSNTEDTGNYSETICLESYRNSIHFNPNYCKDYGDNTEENHFKLQQSFEQNLRANSCMNIDELDVKGVTVDGEIINIELPEGASSVLGVWTLGLGLLGDSEFSCCDVKFVAYCVCPKK